MEPPDSKRRRISSSESLASPPAILCLLTPQQVAQLQSTSGGYVSSPIYQAQTQPATAAQFQQYENIGADGEEDDDDAMQGCFLFASRRLKNSKKTKEKSPKKKKSKKKTSSRDTINQNISSIPTPSSSEHGQSNQKGVLVRPLDLTRAWNQSSNFSTTQNFQNPFQPQPPHNPFAIGTFSSASATSSTSINNRFSYGSSVYDYPPSLKRRSEDSGMASPSSSYAQMDARPKTHRTPVTSPNTPRLSTKGALPSFNCIAEVSQSYANIEEKSRSYLKRPCSLNPVPTANHQPNVYRQATATRGFNFNPGNSHNGQERAAFPIAQSVATPSSHADFYNPFPALPRTTGPTEMSVSTEAIQETGTTEELDNIISEMMNLASGISDIARTLTSSSLQQSSVNAVAVQDDHPEPSVASRSLSSSRQLFSRRSHQHQASGQQHPSYGAARMESHVPHMMDNLK